MNSEIFTPKTKTWASAGRTVVQLWDSHDDCSSTPGSFEVGPMVLRPDGTVFATGSNSCEKGGDKTREGKETGKNKDDRPGKTAIYDTKTKTWTKGPNFPGQNDIADGPAAILPNGNVLVDTNPGYGENPSTLYEFDGTQFLKIPQPTGLNPSNAEGGRMLVTADGTIMFLHVASPNPPPWIWFYHPAGKYKKAWRPQIFFSPVSVAVGTTYTLNGTQFNGLTQGAAFGDDAQSATNYPLVRIRNDETGHVRFARTHDFSTMAVATGSLATGLGAFGLAIGWPGGVWLLTLGSVVMTIVFAAIVTRQPALFTIVMAAGTLCWLTGQALWLAGRPIHRVVFWWIGFLVLTIAGERLEMTRLLRLGATPRAAFLAAAVTLVVGLATISVTPDGGVRLAGAALIGLAVWLGVFDIARRTVRQSGLTRFIAVALLSGYVWLGAAGILALGSGATAAGGRYDAMLHAVMLGFVFSMLFGHAPIIFPAVLGIGVAYRSAFYVHVALLHVSLLLRVAGDLAPWPSARGWGGLLNGVAIVVFLANTAYGALAPRAARNLVASP